MSYRQRNNGIKKYSNTKKIIIIAGNKIRIGNKPYEMVYLVKNRILFFQLSDNNK